ncbi:MAG: phosphopantetheine-binding protein, partial [Gemmatimonadota bacterium]
INRAGEKIAPLEVDGVLMNHPATAQALTFAVPHPLLGEAVAAAVVLKPGATASERELREFVAARLAYFKVPSQILLVDSIPTGPTGKLQRIGLADRLGVVANVPVDDHDRTPPRTPTEEVVAQIWDEVLARPAAGVRQNFFALGGDSVLATRLVARLREQLAVDVSLLAFFDAPSIEGIAAAVDLLLEAEETSAL